MNFWPHALPPPPILGQTKWLSENNCLVNVQSDGESETEEEGGKGEAKELTLFQIMERRYIHKWQKKLIKNEEEKNV